jgi:cytochrome c
MLYWRGLLLRNNSIVLVFTALAVFLSGCGATAGHTAEVTTGGDARRGAIAITRHGCGSCHTIPGISGANGRVGPPLTGIATRTYIAGVLQNTPPNLQRWIQNPQAVVPNTVMPNLGLSHQEVADVAGYLYTLR